MVEILVAVLLQAPPQSPPEIQLPVSIDRVRKGLERRPRFEVPPRRPFQRVFRVRIEAFDAFEDKPWEARSTVPLFVQPTAPPVHFQFLQETTPEEVRASTVHPCCDVMPVIGAVRQLVGGTMKALKERRAKREVEKAMRAAGIRR